MTLGEPARPQRLAIGSDMKSRTSKLLRSWRRDERGGVVLFVATIAPLLIAMGGAVVIARKRED